MSRPSGYSALPQTPSTELGSPVSLRSGPFSPSSPRAPSVMSKLSSIRLRTTHVFLLLAVGLITIPFLANKDTSNHLRSYWDGGEYVTTDISMQHIPLASGGLADHLNIPLTLEARLSYLLSRPALHQWEAELPSRHGCPFYTYSRNTYFFHDGKPEQWEKIGPTDIRRYRSKMVDYLRSVEREGGKLIWDPSMEKDTPKDMRRGIILTGNEGKTLDRLRLSLDMLRNVLHSTLPIELYHFPDELQDKELRAELEESYGLHLVEVSGKRPNGKSWNIKNAAFLHTQFTEFIYLDSDNIPLADPAELFDSIEYQQSGSVFWADLNKDHPDNAIFRILGRHCTDDHWPAEAGQIIFNKAGNNGLNLAVLHLANHMMEQEDMYGFLSYGDKDTFRFSFYALGLHYQQASKIFASAGGYQTQGGESSEHFCGHSMIQWGLTPRSAQHDPHYHPKPAFLHAILAKHRNNLQPSKLFSHITRPRLDGISEPLLVRTLYEFTGDCFAITLKGPDGLPDSPNSMMDYQGLVVAEMKDLLGEEVWRALEEISEKFVKI